MAYRTLDEHLTIGQIRAYAEITKTRMGVAFGQELTLLGDMRNQKAIAGVLVTLKPPTKAMMREVVAAESYTSKFYGTKHPCLQIITIEGLLNGTEQLDAPPKGASKKTPLF